MTPLKLLFYRKYIVIAIISLVVSASAIIYFFRNFEVSPKENLMSETLEFKEYFTPTEKKKMKISEAFDPNALSLEQWQELGFSEKQANTILRYKQVLGGAFSSKEEFRKCYAVSSQMFENMKPYLLLPESTSNKKIYTHYGDKNSNYKASRKKLQIYKSFNPDYLTFEDWIRIGFSEKQANSILKYKNYLGGSFQSKEKLKACYVINDEDYRIMEPFLRFPKKSEKTVVSSIRTFPEKEESVKYSMFDPNDLSLEGWMKIGFTEKQANTILNYKNKFLKGKFKNAEELAACYSVSVEKYKEIRPYIVIRKSQSSSDISASKLELPIEKLAPTDFSKTDLNSITFNELKEFGFDDKAARSFIAFRKKLGGFMTKNQILETYNIDKELTTKLLSVAELNTSEIQKYYLKDAPESWLKDHPYFKYYADKIIFYRISFPEDRKIFAKLKLKPDVESKMKLYLYSDTTIR